MELSKEHKKEIDNLIKIGFENKEDPNKIFEKLMEVSKKYSIIPLTSDFDDKKIIGYNPENFEPIYQND